MHAAQWPIDLHRAAASWRTPFGQAPSCAVLLPAATGATRPVPPDLPLT